MLSVKNVTEVKRQLLKDQIQNTICLFKCVYGDIPAVHPSILFVLGFLEPTAVYQATGRETMDGWSVNFEFFFFNFSFNKL